MDALQDLNPSILSGLYAIGLLVGAIVIGLIIKRIFVGVTRAIARRSSATWDDVIVEHNVIGRVVQIVPALIVYSGIGFVSDLPEAVVTLVRNVAMGYVVLSLTLALNALLSAANTIYSSYEISKTRPLKGFIQLIQIAVWVLGGIMIIAAVADRSPLLLLSGFGAMTAIVLLIFKDTILSLVASVQLTAQDMVRVGDWIEMPQFGADGDVIDVQLHTVKIQNFDKTITTIPTHRLISDSFRNWRGMSMSGGRRIKRSVHIDLNSVRFQTEDEIKHFRRFALLKDYIDRKQKELDDYNAGLPEEVAVDVNQRRLTNIGTFRAYVYNYLRYRDDISDDMTLLVRQLAPCPEGVPIEVYCFAATTAWSEYEGIQSDIFDHLMAIAGEFGLRLYQKPAGADFSSLAQSRED